MLKSCDDVANIADDIIVFDTNASEHNARLHAVLNKLQESGLTLNPYKCPFRLSKLTFFGHDLCSRGIKANNEKVQATQNARPPQNEKKARSFMGLVQYTAKFIPNLATIGRPIMDPTREHVKFDDDDEQQSAFEKLKSLISRAYTLAYSQTSVFERFGVRTIRFTNKKFEIITIWFSNKNSVLEQLKSKINLNQRDRRQKKHSYSQTSVFERLTVRTIPSSNGSFEIKITRSSNKYSVVEQLQSWIYRMIVFWAVMGMISKKKVITLFIGRKCVPASLQMPLYSPHTELFVGRTGILAFKKGSRAA